MFDRNGLDLDGANARAAGQEGNGRAVLVSSSPSIRRKKPFDQVIKFWALNAMICPVLFTLCLAVAAQGIRELVSVMQTRLHQLPFPLIERLRDYEGYSELDLAHLASGLLFLAVTFIWIRVIAEAKGQGPVAGYLANRPFAFGIYASIAGIVLIADAFVFYAGLAAKNNGWTETSMLMPAACTLLYMAGVAGFAAFHQDFHDTEYV